MTPRQKLVRALIEARAPASMIALAKIGHYGDFTSELATPITHLVKDARAAGLESIAKRAMNGEFDG